MKNEETSFTLISIKLCILKFTRLFLLLLLFSVALNGKAQMTILYEFGNNTSESILGNFSYIYGFGDPIGSEYYVGNNGLGFEALFEFEYCDDGNLWLISNLSEMANYLNLEFQINYTVYPSDYQLSMYTYFNNLISTIPELNGTLVSENVVSMESIPYTNFSADSVLKLVFFMPEPESVSINIDYIRISADASTYTALNEEEFVDFCIKSNRNNIEFIPGDNISKYQVIVYSTSGQEIYSNILENNAIISLKDVNGIYIVKVISNNTIHTKKVFLH